MRACKKPTIGAGQIKREGLSRTARMSQDELRPEDHRFPSALSLAPARRWSDGRILSEYTRFV